MFFLLECLTFLLKIFILINNFFKILILYLFLILIKINKFYAKFTLFIFNNNYYIIFYNLLNFINIYYLL